MSETRFSTTKLFFLGLIILLTIQLAHILTFFIILPLEPVYELLSGEGGLRDVILQDIEDWYYVLLLPPILILLAALFIEISGPSSFPGFEKDLKHWLPLEMTSTDIVKHGGYFVAAGIFFFNLFLLFEPLPFFDSWSILRELLIVSGEVLFIGLIIILLAPFFDRGILPGLPAKQRTLNESIRNAFFTLRTTNKALIIGIVFLTILLLFIEEGLLLRRFGDNRWVADPFLDFLDTVVESLGSVANPAFESLGLNIEIRPLFTPGDYTESDPALYRVIFRHLGEGAILTFTCSLASLFFGFILGTLCGTVRVTSHLPIPFVGRRISTWITSVLQRIASAFVEVFRGTPLFVQIFFIWFGLPIMIRNGFPFPLIGWEGGDFSFGLGMYTIKDPTFILDRLLAGILALTLNTAAYQSEIIRSGIQAIPSGQLEAARSLGMPYSQGMRHVVLPQAFRLIIPPLTNEFINLLLNSSLVSTISVFEMTREARNLNNTTFRSVEVFGCLMLVYFIMTYTLSRIFKRMEERFRIPGLGVS
ncbi:MAG: amino acid ABC transporter permease [Candidatus Thorarchaeota archaeon]